MDMAKQNSILKTKLGGDKLSKEEAGKVVTYRILIIFLADLIIGSLLDYVRADSTREYNFVFSICPWLTWVFAALFAGAAAWLVWSIVKKVDVRRYPMPPAMAVALTLFLFGITLLYKSITMVMILSVMVIASVLIAIYYIYTNLLY